MNLNLWTICNATIAPESLTAMFPNAVCHDSTNLVYVASDPEFPTLDLSQETDNLLPMAASALVNSQAITLTPSQAQALFATPHHRLWCGRYENMDTLQADYVVVFGSELDETDLEVANDLVRAGIVAMFSNHSDTDSEDE
jgi:hypothetical protein